MKRLFRTTKGVDPLPPPPPDPPAPAPAQQHQPHQPQQQHQQLQPVQPQQPVKKSLSAMMMGTDNPHASHHSEQKHRKGSVTPFPISVGRHSPLPALPPPPPGPATMAANSTALPANTTTGLPNGQRQGKERSSAPSLLEIQQMEALEAKSKRRDTEAETARRDEWLAAQQQQQYAPPRTKSREVESTASPEGWTTIPQSTKGPSSNDHDPLYASTRPTAPPIGKAANTGSPMRTSPGDAATPNSVQQHPLYLPPGARPPSPPPSLRPGTPSRPSYPSQSRNSQGSVHAVYTDIDPYTSPVPLPPPRERAYSSASQSARSSDHEGSAHGHTRPYQHLTSPAPNPPSKMPRSPQPVTARSPLVKSYGSPDVSSQAGMPPPPMPYAPKRESLAMPEPIMYSQQPPSGEMQAMRMSDVDLGRPVEAEATRDGGGKEKKKFWGMPWGDKGKEKKEKTRDLQVPGSAEDARRSIDGWARDGENSSAHGHGNVTSLGHGEEEHRGRMLGLDLGRSKDKEKNLNSVETVTQAIQMLVAHHDPPFASAYEVCDRINHSSSPETVGKEATRAIRRTFKSGNEQERRTATKIWLIMMRNVSAKGFRANASNKKFLGSLEPILLAAAAKPLVSLPTHKLLADVLGDLTYQYGGEKGCEGLGELWRKIKRPQDPEGGAPLPSEHQLFAPGDFFALSAPNTTYLHASPANSLPPNSRRNSSPYFQHALLADGSANGPMPARGPSPTSYGGRGYHQVPHHAEDMRRLMDECTAGREAARVLAEALVYTRPEELEHKPLIKEFHRKCLLCHESLTGQMEWAQAEAAQSRERSLSIGHDSSESGHHETTMEEAALASMLDAHGALSEALKQHDDLSHLAWDEREMREIKERSKTEVRMDRNAPGMFEHSGNLLSVDGQASTSRSPSPAPLARLPVPPTINSSPGQRDVPLPVSTNPFRNGLRDRSRSPSPDRFGLSQPPRLSASPGRTNSPLGRLRMAGPRPLPNPFRNPSQQSIHSTRDPGIPSRSGTGDTNDIPTQNDEADDTYVPTKPSRKALGKRRAVVDEDNHFDPNDMFGVTEPAKKESSSSEDEITADDVQNPKPPATYAYDAYQEKLEAEEAAKYGGFGGSGSGGSRSGRLEAGGYERTGGSSRAISAG